MLEGLGALRIPGRAVHITAGYSRGIPECDWLCKGCRIEEGVWIRKEETQRLDIIVSYLPLISNFVISVAGKQVAVVPYPVLI